MRKRGRLTERQTDIQRLTERQTDRQAETERKMGEADIQRCSTMTVQISKEEVSRGRREGGRGVGGVSWRGSH